MARKPQKSNMPAALAVVGAPTKYKPEYVAMLLEHFDVEPFYREICEQSVEYFQNGKPKKASEKYKFVPNRMPTLFNFARKIDVAYSTVWRWAERGDDPELERRLQNHIEGKEVLPATEFAKLASLKEFCNAYKEAKEMQKEFLINLGLSGNTPPAAFIFVAKNVTDMKDEKKHLLTGADGGPIDVRLSELSDNELLNLARRGDGRTGA